MTILYQLYKYLFVLWLMVLTNFHLWGQPLTAVTPKENAILAKSPASFQWNSIENATNYKFELSSDSLFSNIIYTTTTSNLEISNPIMLTPNDYYWRIIAFFSSAPNDTSFIHKFEVFTPTQLSGLRLWLKADSVEHINNKVTKWIDLSGNNHHLIQTDTNLSPVKALSPLNNQPTLQFDGINDYLDGGDILNIGTKSQVIYTIAKSMNNNGAIISKSLAGPINNRYSILYENHNLLFLFQDNTNRLITYNSAPINEFQYISTIVNNLTNIIGLQVNNNLIGTNSYNASNNFISTYNFLIGAYNNGAGTIPPYSGYYLKGDIAEVLIFDTILSVESQAKLSAYLSDKYSPPVNLGYDVNVPYGFCDTTIHAGSRFTHFLWNTGDTTESISVHQPGIYWVQTVDRFGWESTDSIYVYFPGNILQPLQYLCANDSIVLQTGLTTPDYHFVWQNGDTTPNFTIYTPGKYYVHITDTLGCTFFSDTISVQYDPFSFEEVLPDSIKLCLGDSLIAFHPQAIIYQWSTNETNSFILPQNTGWYYVTLTNMRGCKLLDSCYVLIKGAKPHPSINRQNFCTRQSSIYIGSSTGNIVQWNWTLQDSLHLSGQNIQHTYTNAGIYQTILHVVDSNTCEGYAFSTDTIHDSPRAAFTFNQGCLGQNATLTSHSYCSDSLTEYYWDIHQSLLTGSSITTNLNVGQHLIKHWVRSIYGCVDTTIYLANITQENALQADANYPHQGINCIENPIIFSWNNHGYLSSIEVSFNSDFSQIFYKSPKNYSQHLSLSTIPYSNTVYWRIWTYNSCNDSVSSPVYYFSRNKLTDINGLSLWLMSDSGYVIDNGNHVKQWNDFSSNHYVFLQNDSNARPYLQNNYYKRPALKFDGTNDYFDGGNILNLGLTGNTIFVFANANNSTGSFIAKSLAGGVNNRYSLLYENNQLEFLYHDNSPKLFNYPLDTFFTLWTINKDEQMANIQFFKNSINIGQIEISSNYEMISDYNFLIGGYNNNAGTIPPIWFLNGHIAEIAMFNRTLSEQERLTVENYLMDKYAPPVRLPNDTILDAFFPFTIKPQGYFTQYLWNTGETTDSITVQSTGYYKVTATDIFGRESTDSIWIQFPDAQFASIYQVCLGDSILITSALGNSMNYNWSNGGTQSYTYVKQEDWYYVTITDANYCYYIDSFFVDIDSLALHPLFVSDTTHLCVGNSLGFNPYSFPITHYMWQPTGDTLPQTTVTQSGYYTLSVTDVVGCQHKDSVFVNIVGKAPIANFSATHTCKGDSTHFTDLSIPLDSSPINTWQWIINNDTLNVQNPSYLFSQYGTYTIKLNVGTEAGCFQTNEQNITVHPLPICDFDAIRFCNNHATNFSSHSHIPTGSITGLTWQWGDGSFSYDNDTTHIYSLSGNYTVCLIAESDEGCIDSITKNIEIKPSPVAGFDVSPSCNNNPTFFADTSQTLYYNPIMHWEWWFGDGAISFTQHPQHVYQQSGNYIITLAIQSLNGCSDTVQKNILVSTKPQANFIADSACVHQSLIIEDASTIVNGTIDEWKWFVHNNFVSSLQNTIVTPTSSGSLPITLIVTSNTRCTDTITKNITVYPKPTVNFDLQPTYGPVPLTVYFNNQSEFGQSYWNFGDGSTSQITQPTHSFTDTGQYTIWLTLTNIHGCKDSISKTVLVVPNLLDLAIEKVFYFKDNLFLTVQVLVANVGTLPIENPYVTLIVDGNRLVSELITDTLFSGDKIIYTFTSKLPITDANPSYICVQGQVWQTQNEVNHQNNEQCIALSEEEQLLNFYPNPAQNNIHILLQLDEDQTINIQLTDITGKNLLYQSLSLEKNLHQLNISVEDFSQGIYFIQIRTKKNTFVHKFMKE